MSPLITAWRRLRHRLYRDRPGWRRSPWAGGGRYWYEPNDGWPDGPTTGAGIGSPEAQR